MDLEETDLGKAWRMPDFRDLMQEATAVTVVERETDLKVGGN